MKIDVSKIKNPLLVSFFSNEENVQLYERYCINPSKKHEQKLIQSFRKHYFKVKAVSYFSKVIPYEARNFDIKLREHKERYIPILDKPVSLKEGNISVADTLVDENSRITDEFSSDKLEDYIGDESIVKAIRTLTERQKQILFLSYIKNLKDVEIAKLLNISQQAVTKTRLHSLKKVRERLQ
jgi:RNA polymerase sigma factor (sigma-70 family)